MIAGDAPEMPKQQPPLSAAKIHLLRQWVLAGAKDDSAGPQDRTLVRIPETYQFAPAVSSVALSPDGAIVAAACRSEVVLIDVTGDAAPRRLPTECDLVTHVEFSPDGKLLAAVGGSPARFGAVVFFHPADGAVAAARRIGHDTLFRGGFAPDGGAIAVGGADGAVHVVPVDAQAEVRSFDLHSDWVLDVAYSPDGKLLVSAGRDKATKVSSLETGELLRSVDASTDLVGSVAADGEFAVSAGKARTLTGYEFKTALAGIEVTGAGNGARPISRRDQYVRAFETQPGEVLDIAMSGDRKQIAVAGAFGEVRVYTIADRKRIAQITGLAAPVYSVALNADGSRLAIGTRSGQVQVFSLPDGKPLKSLAPVPVAAP
jgi:WD40 repeat protein